MKTRIATMAALIAASVSPAIAAPRLELNPEHIGAETARYDHGHATVTLKTPAGSVQIRPMPVEKGRVALSIAVFNQSGRPANFGIENISASVNGIPVAVPTYAQLAEQAERKARTAKIGTALFAGALAGVASTASNHGTAYRHVSGPRGGYTRAIHWEDNTPGIVGATAAVAGGALVIHGIDRKLDYTLDQLGSQILQTTTVDPGSTFGGMVIVPTAKDIAYPAQIRVQIGFNGASYPFAFRLAPAGMGAPAPVPATARSDTMPYRDAPPPADAYPGGE